MDRRAAFFEAAGLASSVLSADEVVSRWGEPSALVGFTVGGVAGHLYGATRRLEHALDEEIPADASVVGLAEFYGRNRVDDAGDLDRDLDRFIREDGERRASYGPAAVAERFRDVVERLGERLGAAPSDRLVPVWTVTNGATTLDDYLATRVVELVVHTDDLAASARMDPVQVPSLAADVAIEVFVELVRSRSGDLDVIRAFARRERAEPEPLRAL